ncbi:hypothetical protein VP01_276g5 [Puccinia sorghi]|uniref:Uncharacterized protein n=1 Tax=Puccinia sorghi TaxID=27349 RepID=A0A0L6V4L0_9BASI|nr:hypothetical protein VP01_276g5 [Puccinia sorghi]
MSNLSSQSQHLEKSKTTAAVYEAFSNSGMKFAEQNVSLSWDQTMGLIIQANLHNSLWTSLDQKVELFNEAHEPQILSSVDILRLLEAAKTEQHLAEYSRLAGSNYLHVSLASHKNTDVSGSERGVTTQPLTLSRQASDPQAFPPCSITYKCNKPLYGRPLQPEAVTRNFLSRKTNQFHTNELLKKLFGTLVNLTMSQAIVAAYGPCNFITGTVWKEKLSQ